MPYRDQTQSDDDMAGMHILANIAGQGSVCYVNKKNLMLTLDKPIASKWGRLRVAFIVIRWMWKGLRP